jgi:hypothetical protein
MNFLCGYQRKTLVQVKPHLITENTIGADACAVGFVGAAVKYFVEKIFVLLQDRSLSEGERILLLKYNSTTTLLLYLSYSFLKDPVHSLEL